jgi:hypothetical protein
VPELTPFEQRMLAGLRQVEPPKRPRRWLPVLGTAAVAATVLLLSVVRPSGDGTSEEPVVSSPIRYLKWLSPRDGADPQWTDEVWIDDTHHTVRLKSPDFDRTFTDVPEPIALNRPGMPAEFARMSPDVLVADQRTAVAGLPHTDVALDDAVRTVAKATGRHDGEVLADLLSKPGLGPDMRARVVRILLGQHDVGLLDPTKARDLTGRTGTLYLIDAGPLSMQMVIDVTTNTVLSMDKDTIVNQ